MPDSPNLESLFVRLYFDRHIMARLATDLRGRGFDVSDVGDALVGSRSLEASRGLSGNRRVNIAKALSWNYRQIEKAA